MNKIIVKIIGLILILSSCHVKEHDNTSAELERQITSEMERAYFEGQKDALLGDVRIERINGELDPDTLWRWTSSPWDSGKEPIYHPPIK